MITNLNSRDLISFEERVVEAFQLMASNIDIVKLEEHENIFPAYQHAYDRSDGVSSIIVEYCDSYNEK